jgi:DNA-binding PadR family transcriptional regulator
MQMYTNGMKVPSPMEMQLLFLVSDDEHSGREVANLYHKEAGKPIAYGTLYTTFRRLRERGWVKVRDGQDEDGRVRYFRIDVDGRRALRDGRAFYDRTAGFGLPEGKPI